MSYRLTIRAKKIKKRMCSSLWNFLPPPNPSLLFHHFFWAMPPLLLSLSFSSPSPVFLLSLPFLSFPFYLESWRSDPGKIMCHRWHSPTRRHLLLPASSITPVQHHLVGTWRLTCQTLVFLSDLFSTVSAAKCLLSGSCFLWRAQCYQVATFRQSMIPTHQSLLCA